MTEESIQGHGPNIPSGGRIPPGFEAIWREIVRYDAEPIERIPAADAEAHLRIEKSLARFGEGVPVLLDSDQLADRPRLIPTASVAEIFGSIGSIWEFVVLVADGSAYWAVIEEEHEWLIFERRIGIEGTG
ncbi:MAG: hypothetical protein EOP83_28165 [Verrucomicrobiaceae bacterium]|nr:MAG: hypothetical protein EOP83_28165 [Verrucomicrobiaceae bacterium]